MNVLWCTRFNKYEPFNFTFLLLYIFFLSLFLIRNFPKETIPKNLPTQSKWKIKDMLFTCQLVTPHSSMQCFYLFLVGCLSYLVADYDSTNKYKRLHTAGTLLPPAKIVCQWRKWSLSHFPKKKSEHRLYQGY